MNAALLLAVSLSLGLLLWQRPPRSSAPVSRSAGAGANVLAAGSPGRPLLAGVRERFERLTRRSDSAVEVGSMVAEVAVLVRAGALPQQAWQQAAGRRPRVARALRRGDDLPVRRATAGAHAALRLADRTGAPPAEVLDHCAGSLTEAAAAETARAAALAGPRSTARLLAALPLLGLALGVAIGADPLAVFTDGSWGTACLLVGTALMVAGHLWVRRELHRARRAA